MVTVTVKPFNWSSVKENRIYSLFGKRGSGKSTMMKYMVDKLGPKWDYACGVTPTRESSEYMRKVFGPCMVRPKFDKKLIECCIQVSKGLDKRGKRRKWGLIVDDCGYDKDALKGEIMRDLFMNGRQYGCDVIYSFQYCMDLTPDMRSQIDYVITFWEPKVVNREKLWKQFFGVFTDFNDFNKVLSQCTQDNEVLILDNTVKSSNPYDCIFWSKADINTPCNRVGRPIFWAMMELAFKETENDDILANVFMDENELDEKERQNDTGETTTSTSSSSSSSSSSATTTTVLSGKKRKRGASKSEDEEKYEVTQIVKLPPIKEETQTSTQEKEKEIQTKKRKTDSTQNSSQIIIAPDQFATLNTLEELLKLNVPIQPTNKK